MIYKSATWAEKSPTNFVWITNRPGELGALRAHLEYPAGKSFALIERRRVVDLLGAHQLARDAGGLARAARRDDDADAGMTKSSHRASPRVDHKTYQKPATTATATTAALLKRRNPREAKTRSDAATIFAHILPHLERLTPGNVHMWFSFTTPPHAPWN